MIKSFTYLHAWQSAHQLSLDTYNATAGFPASEQFGLTSQMRRAAVSITSNIAEGFGRATKNDQEHFYVMASGSLYGLKSQIMLARDLNYVDKVGIEKLCDCANQTHRLLHGLIRAHKSNV